MDETRKNAGKTCKRMLGFCPSRSVLIGGPKMQLEGSAPKGSGCFIRPQPAFMAQSGDQGKIARHDNLRFLDPIAVLATDQAT